MHVLNPTARLSGGGARWSLKLRRSGRAPTRMELPPSLARALIDVGAGADATQLFDADVLGWLTERQVLLTGQVARRPRYVCGPPADPRPNDGEGFDPAFQLRAGQNHYRVVEMALWGAAVAEYSVDAPMAAVFVDACSGVELPADHQAELRGMGCLRTPAAQASRRQLLDAVLHHGRAQFGQRRWVVARHLFAPAEVHALCAYADAHLARGLLDGDFVEGGKQRSHLYDDPELSALHGRAAVFASAVSGLPLIPSYSFLAMYHPGGILPFHRDRGHCPVSLSLALRPGEDWPLHTVDPSGRPADLFWSAGESLLFDGHAIGHGRPPLQGKRTSLYLVLHFDQDPDAQGTT